MIDLTRSAVANWLTFSARVETPTGTSRAGALRAAGELKRLILEGLVSPADVQLTEEAKDVLWALAELFGNLSGQRSNASVADANTVYQFVRRLDWPSDSFEEKRGVLRALAQAGWSALGMTLDEVYARRSAASVSVVNECTTDPASTSKPRVARLVAQEEAAQAADFYLTLEARDRSSDVKARYLADIDVLLAICRRLKDERDRSPEKVALEAVEAYEFVAAARSVGVFDERKYVLGELAHLAAGAKRFLGQREQVEVWLCRAEAAFRQTVNPAGSLTQVSYTRLALLYEMGRHEDVLELLPDVQSAFAELGMATDYAKARLFQAMVLKAVNRPQDALPLLESMAEDPRVREDVGLYGRILVDLGDTEQLLGEYEKAICAFQKALPLLKATRQPMAVADLQAVVGSTYRNIGRAAASADAFAEAKAGFAALGMLAAVAYISVLRADALLASSRYREAEMELLGALPTIEEQKMVPEGFAAVALLKESVRRRKTDPNALRELREHLQANR